MRPGGLGKFARVRTDRIASRATVAEAVPRPVGDCDSAVEQRRHSGSKRLLELVAIGSFKDLDNRLIGPLRIDMNDLDFLRWARLAPSTRQCCKSVGLALDQIVGRDARLKVGRVGGAITCLPIDHKHRADIDASKDIKYSAQRNAAVAATIEQQREAFFSANRCPSSSCI